MKKVYNSIYILTQVCYNIREVRGAELTGRKESIVNGKEK